LFARPSQDTICRFRTCYPTTLWPIEVDNAKLETAMTDGAGRTARAAIVLRLRTLGDVRLSELELESLRFYLSGESGFVGRLYEALLGHCYRLELRAPDGAPGRAPLVLPPGSLAEVGFGSDEGMLPYSHRSFLGYRLLQEYFQFPEKFFFLDVRHLTALRATRFGNEALLVFFLDEVPQLEQPIRPDHFRLGCAPVVNLFQQIAEPIRLDHAHAEYRVVPDVRRQRTIEVYSIDRVTSVAPSAGDSVEFQPFYSFKHAIDRREQHAFWHSTRRPSERKGDHGTEVFLSLVNLDFRPTVPETELLTLQVTCTNRDLPGQLPFGDPAGDFDMEGSAPVKRINCLVKPTRTERPPMGHGLQWRLISQLSLNYLSAVGGGRDGNPEVLREILRLYDFSESPAVQQQISGLVRVGSRQVLRRIRSELGSGFARGLEATLEFDESKYVGSSVYLFSSVLEKFLGLYVSINSFSEMVAVSRQRGVLRRWPPRSGQQVLL
jgi:type VI secretion system protein ImpG